MSKNYTMIDDLEDISDMPEYQDHIPNDISEKIKGKIRNNYMAPPSSGMNYLKQQRQMMMHQPQQQMMPPKVPQQIPMHRPPMPKFQYDAAPLHKYDFNEDDEEEYYPMIKEGFSTPPPASEITCKQVADHVADCPVCGRLYHNDRMHTLYIIMIVFLSIACLLLLKKNLNV